MGWKLLDGHSKNYSVFLGNFYLIGIQLLYNCVKVSFPK